MMKCFLPLFLVLIAVTSAWSVQKDIPGPADSSAFGAGVTVLQNGNIVVRDPSYSGPDGATEIGAVYLYSAAGSQISKLTGSTPYDRIGSGIVILDNGNYLIVSPEWDNGAQTDVGAVTWASGATGISGSVTATNSLIGEHTDDDVGYDILKLSSGDYLVCSPQWNNGTVSNAGAVTWGSAETGVTGPVSSSNSLLGSSQDDHVGERIVRLGQGNYLVISASWDRSSIIDAGAVTWGSGTAGVKGVISETNSLVGSSQSDQIGGDSTRGVRLLSTGDYVICSPDFDGAAGGFLKGAVTWCHRDGSTVGIVSEANSFVGKNGDRLGSEGAVDLGQGRYAVVSPLCNRDGVEEVGAVTWFAGGGAITGTVSVSNSLMGEKTDDHVGGGGVVALTNGHYVVSSPEWDLGTVTDAGAVTWCNGSTGRTGTVASVNSLTGSSADDEVGEVVALTNGHYVVGTDDWDNGGLSDVGAVTWCNGTTATIGVVSTTNSLTGTQADDTVGWGIYPLNNGHYVVQSIFWNNGAASGAGAVTWCNGTAPTSATVSASNSLVGSQAFDGVGYITPLSNGHYLVTTSDWDNGSKQNAGSVTWGSGTTGVTGPVSLTNSLIGTLEFDRLGSRVVLLRNGNYLVISSHANQSDGAGGVLTDTGAVTFGNGATGVKGTVSAANSLYGTRMGDRVGYGMGAGVVELSDGNYLVASDEWNFLGSVTWCSGSTGRTGMVSAANSLTGKSDFPLGNNHSDVSNWIKPHTDGSYLLACYYSGLQNSFGYSKAITYAAAGGSTLGAISPTNSYFDTGTSVGDGTLIPDYDPARKQVVIGNDKHNKIILARFGTGAGTTPTVTVSTADLAANSTSLTINGSHFSALAADNVVTFNNGVTGTITAATNTQLTVSNLIGLTAGPLNASVRTGLSADSPDIQVARVVPLITGTSNPLAAGTPLIIHGHGFSAVPGNNILTLSDGATGTVTAATSTQLTVSLTNIISGPLSASVKVNGVTSSGGAITVATVTPTITPSSGNIGLGSSSLLISGQGFSAIRENNIVSFSGTATGTVTMATPTLLTVTGLSGLTPGALNVTLTVNGQSSGTPIQVANVISDASGTIAFNAAAYAVDQDAASVVLTLVRGGSTSATAVSIHTEDGTASAVPPFAMAKADTDYTALAGIFTTVSFAQGDESKTVTLTIKKQTATTTPNKRFTVTLSDPVGGSSLGSIATTTVQILAFDTKIPTLKVTAPTATVSTALPFLVKGTAGDARGIERVEVFLNEPTNPQYATLETAKSPTSVPFSLGITPLEGKNTLRVRAFDFQGNFQDVVRTFTFTLRYRLTLGRVIPTAPGLLADKVGTVTLAATPSSAASALTPTIANSNPKTSDVLPGASVKLTAVSKTGYAFSHWDGLPGSAIEQGNIATFNMPVDGPLAVTAHFIANPFMGLTPGGTTFYGLLQADDDTNTPSTNDTEGYLTATMTGSTGALSGQIMIGGVVQKFAAAARGDGQVFFTVGKIKQTTLPFGTRLLSLNYNASAAQNALSAVLSRSDSSGVSAGFALRTLYNGKTSKVPAGLLNSSSKGFYTLAFPAKLHPTLPAAAYPQGTGFATVSLTTAGVATYALTLPDGSTATCSSGLTLGDRSPVFFQQVTPGAKPTVKGGSFGGVFQFTAGTGNNVTATDLLWFRPAAVDTAPRPYTLGWPEGVTVDAWGSLYDAKRTVQATLNLPQDNPATGNARLGFLLGRLATPVTFTKFNIKASSVIKIPATDKTYSLVLGATKGTFSGTFTPDWVLPKTLPTFKGMLIQQGTLRGGHGFFLSNVAGDPYPESGVVELGPPEE